MTRILVVVALSFLENIKENIFMKRDLVDILCCPTCKTDLELTVKEEKDGEIISGHFICVKCKTKYPITDGIPDLLPR